MAVTLIILVSLLAAAVNAVAGGGTFLAFPALTGLGGLTEIVANITCTIGLWPGSAAAVAAARSDLKIVPRGLAVSYCIVCLCGGTIGSLLLLHTSAQAFSLAIPWLLLFATTVFAFGKRIAKWAGRGGHDITQTGGGHNPSPKPPTANNPLAAGAPHATAAPLAATATHAAPAPHAMAAPHAAPAPNAASMRWTIFVGVIQFIVAIYGGYFGAGIGVLTLAGLSFAGIGDLKKINALKVLLSTATNLAAAIIFLFGPVPWRFAGPMAAASTVGGFAGMAAAQRLPQSILRGIILTIAIALTAAYFVKTYG